MLTGLRGRTAAALALVSIITLAVVAVALLSPLERNLRGDEVENLVSAAKDSRLSLSRLPSEALRAGDERLVRTVRSARRRGGGGDAAVVDAGGRVLALTDPDKRESFPDGVRALQAERLQRGIVGTGAEREVAVAIPVTVDDRRVALVLRKSLDDVSDAAAVVRRAFVLAAAISLTIAVLVGLALSGRLVGRLRSLRDTVERVAAIGPHAEVQTDSAHDEVGDLTRAFTVMQARLREQEQARRAFVATASHELRTPLSSLLIMLDLLRSDLEREPVDLDDARRQADRAEGQAQRLSALAATLLDLSRIDAGLPLRRDVVDLTELTRAVAAEFAVRADEQQSRLVLPSEQERWALADPGATAQVLRILIDNALRHGPDGTEVELAVHAGSSGAEVLVCDRGPGVPVGDRERIFERFERGDSTSPGFGLGLAIGRELARRMDGELRLVPEAEGGCFALRLPPAPTL